jgi:Fe-S cluster biogenesis protein NfuA
MTESNAPQIRSSSSKLPIDLHRRMEQVLDREIRPALSEDGGGVEIVGIDEDQIVQVRLLGSCRGCSSAVLSLTLAIEAALKKELPEIRFVEAVP